MTTIALNQKRSSSFLSSLVFFIGITGLIFAFFFLGKRHYHQSKNEAPNYKAEEEFFERLPDEVLPPKMPKEKIYLDPLNPQETYERLTAQNQWKSTILQRHFSGNKRVDEKINMFLSHFYHKFRKNGLKEWEKKLKTEIQTIRPKKVNGRATTKETLTSDIETCKKIFPQLEQAEIFWDGFGGWLKEEEEGEKEDGDTVLMGLCISSPRDPITKESKGGVALQWSPWGDRKENICCWTYRRISIKLKPELFFFRYNSWVTIDKDPMKPKQLRIGWDQLIETIAHELAHAVINSILINDKVAKLVEGHGGLHDDFTKRIKEMIEKSDKYTKFKKYINSLDRTQ